MKLELKTNKQTREQLPRCPGRFGKKQQMRILEMSNKITGIKSPMQGLKKRLDIEEEPGMQI